MVKTFFIFLRQIFLMINPTCLKIFSELLLNVDIVKIESEGYEQLLWHAI